MGTVTGGWRDRGRGLMALVRGRHSLQIVAAGLALLGAILISALLYGDLPEFLHVDVPEIGQAMRQLFLHYSYVPGFALLYVEESGIPLPAPGDVFVMYVGVHIPHTIWAWLAAWLGLVLAVVLGATNLFLVSRRIGHRLVHSRFADYVHLSPERLEKAEAWFKKYGVLAIIFGRHIPGFRVPITVAAGTLGVPYRVFAPSVAVSTAIWAGIMLTVGITVGPQLARLLLAHSEIYLIWGAIIVLLIASIYIRQRRRAASGRGGSQESKRPVESPSS